VSERRIVRCGGISAGVAPSPKEALELALHGPRANVSLKISDVSEAMAASVPDILVDLLEIASYVYAADQATSRGEATDAGGHWRRHFRFYIPVRQPEVWSQDVVSVALADTLSFLSDDDYEFCFSRIEKLPPVQLYLDNMVPGFQVDDVMLFSGGLDSLSGAIHETIGEGRRVALVSHASAKKRRPQVRQLVQEIEKRAPAGSIRHVPVWATKDQTLGRDHTQRSRSFLYASLAASVAVMLGRDRFRFYENGVTSMNLPPVPQVVGGRATRTTHPTTLHRWLRHGRTQTRGRYRKFLNAVEKARAEGESRDVALIAKAASTDWKAAAWRLERRAPRRYGLRVQVSVQQELEAILDRLQNGLMPDAYEKVLELIAAEDAEPGQAPEETLGTLQRVE
jgi:hypothetical protein